MKQNKPFTSKTTNQPTRDDFPTRLSKAVCEHLKWELISSYSRAQALADGVLIDVTELAHEAGFRYPVAIMSAAWHDCVEVSAIDRVHDATGRLWDVLNVLQFAIKANRDGSEIRFCVDVADEREQLTRVELKCLCGPGDDAEPVLTIMLPEED